MSFTLGPNFFQTERAVVCLFFRYLIIRKNVISKNMKRAFACAGDQFLLDAVALIIVFRSSYNRC